MSKADYVRSELRGGLTGHHTCHWPGCSKLVTPAAWGCKPHWYKLPHDLRSRIWRAFRPGQEKTKTPSAEYVAVALEAQDWIAAHSWCGVCGKRRPHRGATICTDCAEAGHPHPPAQQGALEL